MFVLVIIFVCPNYHSRYFMKHELYLLEINCHSLTSRLQEYNTYAISDYYNIIHVLYYCHSEGYVIHL